MQRKRRRTYKLNILMELNEETPTGKGSSEAERG